MKTCYIVGAGVVNLLWLSETLPADAFIFGVDGGYSKVLRAGRTPCIFVGDGDSSQIPDKGDMLLLSPQKNATDLEEAVNHALTMGFEELILLGVTGGRLDHFFGNIALLESIYDRKQKGVILDEQNKITYHHGGVYTIKKSERYTYVSIIPLDRELTRVSLVGFAYPLYNATLERSKTRGISNQMIAKQGTISTQSGACLIIESVDTNDLPFV